MLRPVSILILDDDPERHRLFAQNLRHPRTLVRHVSTAAEAIDALRRQHYDIIFLDYDLHQHGIPIEISCTGRHVSDWVVRRASHFKGVQFIVHSLNPLSAGPMVDDLEAAGLRVARAPWIWEDADRLAFHALFPAA
jgi:hypothetical protein